MYVVHLRDGRSMADSSKRNYLAVLGDYFQTDLRWMKLPDPYLRPRRGAVPPEGTKRAYLTKREADILLSSISPKYAKASTSGESSPHLFLNAKGERGAEKTLRRRLYGWVRKSASKSWTSSPMTSGAPSEPGTCRPTRVALI